MRGFFRSSLTRAGFTLAFFGLAAKLVGLLRDRVLASHFGASAQLDIYYSAFKIPDLIVDFFILGAVSSAIIPIFIEYRQRDRAQAWRLVQNFFNTMVIVVACVAVVAWFVAPLLAKLVAPGFSSADLALLAHLLRIMLASPIIFAASIIVGSVLQALERFVAYSIAPIMYNLGIIVGAVYLAPLAKAHGIEELYGLGAGVVLGALLHLLIQLPSAIASGLRFKLVIDLADSGLQRVVRLMIPRAVGVGANGIGALVMNAFASMIGSGSIAVLNLANNLQFVPISVVGISIATAVFPRLSAHVSAQEYEHFRQQLSVSLRRTGVIVGILALAVLIFRELIVRIILQTGAFQGASVQATAAALGIFMFGIIAHSLVPIMSRAFFAMQNTITPVIAAIVAIAVNILFAGFLVFVLGWGVQGLAVSYALAGNVNFFILYILFRARYGR